MIWFQQHRLLGWVFIYLLIFFQGTGAAYSQNEWDIKSIENSQSTSTYFQDNPEVSIIWGYSKGSWSAAANPSSSQAVRLSQLSTQSVQFSSLTTLHAGKSYWIFSNDESIAVTMSLSGSSISTYGPGYHLISGSNETVSSYLQRHPEVSQIWAWNKNSKNYSIAEQGAFPEYASLSRVQTLESGRGYWIKVDHQFSIYGRTSIPQAVKNHSAAVDINGNIFSHGGITESGVTNQLLKYDIRNNSWSILPSSVVSRSHHSMIHHQGKLYVWGGRNEDEVPLNSLEIFDTNSQQWSSVSSGGQSRYSHSSVFYDSKIYHWGGVSDEFPYVLNSMDIYDIESGIWSSGTSGGIARSKHESIIIDKYMYTIGGSSGSFDRYNIESDSWSLSVGPDVDRQFFTLTFVKNNILLIGGLDNQFNSINKHSLLNPGESERFQIHELLVERSSHQSILFGGKLYSFGGEDNSANILDTLEVLVIDPISKTLINSPPEILNIEVVGSGSDLTINFDLRDQEGDFQIDLDLEYSLDQGSNYYPANGFAASSNGFKPGLDQNIVWETLRDFDTDQSDVMIRLIAKDGLSVTTNPAYSDSFDVNNGRPSIQNVSIISRPPNDIVSVAFQINDVDGDLADISMEYSIDGGTNYQSVNQISGETRSLETSNNKIYVLSWHSRKEINDDQHNTRLRLSIADINGVSENYGISDIFSVLNSSNSTPTVEPEFVDEFGDRIAINLSLTDQNLDLIDLLVEYSVDGGSTFHLASIVPEDSIKIFSQQVSI